MGCFDSKVCCSPLLHNTYSISIRYTAQYAISSTLVFRTQSKLWDTFRMEYLHTVSYIKKKKQNAVYNSKHFKLQHTKLLPHYFIHTKMYILLYCKTLHTAHLLTCKVIRSFDEMFIAAYFIQFQYIVHTAQCALNGMLSPNLGIPCMQVIIVCILQNQYEKHLQICQKVNMNGNKERRNNKRMQKKMNRVAFSA